MKIEKVSYYLLILMASICALFLFRFLPHPPNFTPVIAMAFYLPVLFGLWSIPFIILAFGITDYFIGFHSLLFWTWGSLALISLISKFSKNTSSRIFLCLSATIIFFIISNFGVWLSGYYGYSIESLILCYTMAIPFYTNTMISTLFFAGLIELFMYSKYYLYLSAYKNKIN
jgi:hypothetical protein